VVLGFFGGVLVTGATIPRLSAFYQSTPRGTLLLPATLGVSYGVVVLAIVLLAMAGFSVAQRLEQRAVRQRA
jgi:hypothetical protein